MKTTAKALRMDTKRILDAVERGEEVIVSKRGKACARIVPVKGKTIRDTHETALFGIWKQHPDTQDVNAFVDSLRSGRI